ncbi:UNKNOWN [Stylonychia lemnae]|uniref:Uncharacterized protein n=1 Tax=Stylonychia lemnae TaxID=5949 RepID=A0A078AIN2_STYLE|nr:UNKNOWN [Stylonychia lemnae]|eukprot:CDW82079.1 UNKNOWN [Stylonychia lemnae]
MPLLPMTEDSSQLVLNSENSLSLRITQKSIILDPVVPEDDVKERLKQQRPQNLNKEGDFICISQEHRTQEQNYKDALHKMQEYINTASIIPKERVYKEFKESETQEFRRIDYKRKRSDVKSNRGSKWDF